VAAGFTKPGQRQFVEWVTGLAFNVEAHTLTQSLLGLDRVQDGKRLETFAAYGSWNERLLQTSLRAAIERLPDSPWYGYRVWAGDDTKVHRSSPHVWGTCTFHEYTARCPNRASTVRAPNWVVLGRLLPIPQQPARFLPVAGQWYFRQSQVCISLGDVAQSHKRKCGSEKEFKRTAGRVFFGEQPGSTRGNAPARP
jgi:hypothetical protein